MIKQILSFILMCSGMATAFAAYQYDAANISAASADVGGDRYAAVVNRGGWGDMLQNSMLFNSFGYLSVSFCKSLPSAFGVYVLDGRQVSGKYTLA